MTLHAVPPTTELASCQALLTGLVARQAWAERELLVRFTARVERVITRITGDVSADLDDRVQETFVRVLERVHLIRDADSLPAFVTRVAVNVARESLRARRRRRWLSFFGPADVPEAAAPVASDDVRGAYLAFYRVVDTLGEDERIVFVLRHVEGMELREVGEVVGLSLATVKRRLAEAQRTFLARASVVPDLEDWLSGSRKWST